MLGLSSLFAIALPLYAIAGSGGLLAPGEDVAQAPAVEAPVESSGSAGPEASGDADRVAGSTEGEGGESAKGSEGESATGSEGESATGSEGESATGSEGESATGSQSDSATDPEGEPTADPEGEPTSSEELPTEEPEPAADLQEPSGEDPSTEAVGPGGAAGGSGAGASGGPGSIGAGGGGAGGGASGGGSGGALASGSVRSDDDELREQEDAPEVGRRALRQRRRQARREGQWQVFAPYPELGPIRYRDPEQVRVIWLRADVSGSWLPPSLGLSEGTVWTARPAGAWAVALTPWLALGGRHHVAWFDAQQIRTRIHSHQVELSGRPLAGSRPDIALDDRLSLGVSTHAIRWSETAGRTIEPGGLGDTIVHLGYGLDHLLGTRWRLGWQAQARYVWVHRDTQRHARLSARLAFHPRPAHRLFVDAVGFYVNRDAQPRGRPLPRHSVYGQFGLGYAWMANAGVGPFIKLRYTTGFMSGEAPVYELRTEALGSDYVEATVGIMARLR